MGFSTEYYSSKTDKNRLNDVIPSKSTGYLRKLEQDTIAAIWTSATTLFTIAGITFDDDNLIGGYLLVKLSSTKTRFLPITDNANSTITVDPTDSLCEEDVASDLIDETSYNLKVWSDDRCGGETTAKLLTPNDEYKEFVSDYPEKVEFDEIIRRRPEWSLTWRTTGISLDKDIRRMKDLNESSTTFTHLATGHDPIVQNTYMIIFQGMINHEGKEIRTIILNCKMRPSGDLSEEADVDGFIEYPVMLKAYIEDLCPDDENYYRRMTEK